jgi:hypothetical protein
MLFEISLKVKDCGGNHWPGKQSWASNFPEETGLTVYRPLQMGISACKGIWAECGGEQK